jgi:5'-nucleotidase
LIIDKNEVMEKIKSNHRPMILVTNDDGVEAKGIKSLIEAVRPFGDVVVVAPDQAMSGMSHAITVKVPLYLTKIHSEEGLQIYKSNGTPADCVKLAIHVLFDKKPDCVVSGINHGTNSSVSMHYSGTVGGAREGVLNGIPSIGFSLLEYGLDADFSTAVKYVRAIFNNVLTHGMDDGIFYNVNIPAGNEVMGVKVCLQSKGRWVEEFEMRVDPRGRTYFWLTGHFENHEVANLETDEWALNSGYVSVVPCSLDATHAPSLDVLRSQGIEQISNHNFVNK